MMTEIGVHIEEPIEIVFESVIHACEDCRAEAELCGPMKHLQTRIVRCQLVGKPASAVRRVVVDDEQLCRRHGFVNLRQQREGCPSRCKWRAIPKCGLSRQTTRALLQLWLEQRDLVIILLGEGILGRRYLSLRRKSSSKMATPTILIVCPECGKQIKAPQNVLGKKVRCKFCQAAFVADADSGKAPPAKPDKANTAKPAKTKTAKPAKPKSDVPLNRQLDDEEEDGANPYGLVDVSLAPARPECVNVIDEDQVICLHCGYNLRTRKCPRLSKPTIRRSATISCGYCPASLAPWLFSPSLALTSGIF